MREGGRGNEKRVLHNPIRWIVCIIPSRKKRMYVYIYKERM